MIGLAVAVLVASVLGSLHCVGMCGPLALWASGAGQKQSGTQVWTKLTAYHFGRLLTYLTAGTAAGIIGSLVSAGGSLIGLQSLAARLVGGGMIAFGIIRLAEITMPGVMKKRATVADKGKPGASVSPMAGTGASGIGGAVSGKISAWIAGRRPLIQKLPGLSRGVAAGALTTLLPCGWLYVFVLVAAGTGSVLPALMVMAAFWIGTLPALTALVVGSFGVAARVRPALPLLGCVLLLVTGFYTATGRAAADLRPLTMRAAELAAEREAPQSRLANLTNEPLPCCVEK